MFNPSPRWIQRTFRRWEISSPKIIPFRLKNSPKTTGHHVNSMKHGRSNPDFMCFDMVTWDSAFHVFFDRFPWSLILPWSKSIRIKALYGIDSLVTKIASGATTGALGAFLANPVAPWTPSPGATRAG